MDVVIAAEDAGLYRDAFGVMPPGGLPESFLEPVDDPMDRILLRYARSRGPFTTRDAASRFALEPGVVEGLLAVLEARDLLVRGELRPGGVEREWCDPDVLRRIRRASLAVLRRQVEPAEQAALGRFLPSWHGIDRRATLREALVPLQGLALPVALWESEILPRRVPGYQPASLDQLCASGDVVWVGAGLDRVALYYREDAAVLGPPGTGEPLAGPVHDSIRGVLAQSAEFWPDLVAAVGSEVADVLPVLWELVWNGEVTNDAWAPLRAKRRYGMPATERRPRRFSRSRVSGDVATAGRWSLSGRLFAGDTVSLAGDRRALAELLLERQGIVTRDGVRAEGIPGGYGAVYGELRALENVGACRRGYFVEGLGGAQFALPGAVERLRELRDAGDEDALVLAAAEPAQPYGGVLPMAETRGRPCRARGGSPRRAAVWRGGALRRARRPLAATAARPRPRVASPGARCARRVGAGRSGAAAVGRALRRPVGRRERCPAAPGRGRLPRGASAGGVTAVIRLVRRLAGRRRGKFDSRSLRPPPGHPNPPPTFNSIV